jgi:hypothetical protein
MNSRYRVGSSGSEPDFESVYTALSGAKAVAYLCARATSKDSVYGAHSLIDLAVRTMYGACDTKDEAEMQDVSALLAQTLAILDSICDGLNEEAVFGLITLVAKVKNDLDCCIHAFDFPDRAATPTAKEGSRS